MPHLSSIHIYPIKSTAPIQLQRSYVEAAGLSFDRRLVISAPDGQFITARKYPELLRFKSALCAAGLYLTAPDGDSIMLQLQGLATGYDPVEVWGDRVDSQRLGPAVDSWLSAKLGRPCRLHYFGTRSERHTALAPDRPVAFADGYPLLLTSQASLDDLNRRSRQPVPMGQFRPNVVVAGTAPFAEDSWRRIRIGAVEFALVKPCSRCVMTTYDSRTAQALGAGEPLRTLAAYRRGEDNAVYFGQNLIPLSEGQIEAGDAVEILETAPAPVYADNAPFLPPVAPPEA